LKAKKSDRWQDSTSEIEDIGVDRWRVFINRLKSNLVDHFGVLEVEEPGVLHPDLRSLQRNSESMKSLVGEPTFVERIRVRHFGIFEDKRSGFFVPKFLKS
jgi:hypothetical protein